MESTCLYKKETKRLLMMPFMHLPSDEMIVYCVQGSIYTQTLVPADMGP